MPREFLVSLAIAETLLLRMTLFLADLREVSKMTFDFDFGKPFRPFEQLMGVLPEASKSLIPQAYQVPISRETLILRLTHQYQDLMYNPTSPILDFYPQEFELDLNGKKQDWEAIVKIPFIDEKRLLSAMACPSSL